MASGRFSRLVATTLGTLGILALAAVPQQSAAHAGAVYPSMRYSITATTYAPHASGNWASVTWSGSPFRALIYFTFAWGDGTSSLHECVLNCASGTSPRMPHSYPHAGSYSVCVQDNLGDGRTCVQVQES